MKDERCAKSAQGSFGVGMVMFWCIGCVLQYWQKLKKWEIAVLGLLKSCLGMAEKSSVKVSHWHLFSFNQDNKKRDSALLVLSRRVTMYLGTRQKSCDMKI